MSPRIELDVADIELLTAVGVRSIVAENVVSVHAGPADVSPHPSPRSAASDEMRTDPESGSCHITVGLEEETGTLTLDGVVDCQAAAEIRRLGRCALAVGSRLLVLDFEQANFAEPGALDVLLELADNCAKRQGHLSIEHLDLRTCGLLRQAGLGAVIIRS